MNYPKHPRDIRIRIIRREIEDGLITGLPNITSSPLSDKMIEYLVALGFGNAHMAGITTELMTRGKVRVDFRLFVERLELVFDEDRLTLIQAVSLLGDYIAELSKGRNIPVHRKTQNVIIEPQKPIKEDETDLELNKPENVDSLEERGSEKS
jgi:hypothetical protein